jgi:hypothetical protein
MIADSKLDVVKTAGPDVEGQFAKETSSRAENNIDCPSLSQILSKLSPGPSILPVQTISSVPVDEQAALLRRLEDALAEATGGAESFEEAQTILMELWKCGSSYLALAADALANGSRNGAWSWAVSSSEDTDCPPLSILETPIRASWHLEFLPSDHRLERV